MTIFLKLTQEKKPYPIFRSILKAALVNELITIDHFHCRVNISGIDSSEIDELINQLANNRHMKVGFTGTFVQKTAAESRRSTNRTPLFSNANDEWVLSYFEFSVLSDSNSIMHRDIRIWLMGVKAPYVRAASLIENNGPLKAIFEAMSFDPNEYGPLSTRQM